MTRFGHFCYRYRQYVSMALLIVSIIAARPITTNRTAEISLNVAAFALVLIGGSIRSWAMGYHTWRRVRESAPKRRLISAGPYALVRNPLYLGTLLISAGIALMSGSVIIMVTYLMVFWLGYYAIILWEESSLITQFGESYRGYFGSVPRLVPGLKIWKDREGTFSLSTMMRCMEPAKTVAFMVALGLMLWLKQGR